MYVYMHIYTIYEDRNIFIYALTYINTALQGLEGIWDVNASRLEEKHTEQKR